MLFNPLTSPSPVIKLHVQGSHHMQDFFHVYHMYRYGRCSHYPRRACAQRGLPSARMRSEGYCSWVCLSVKSHLTYGASVRPENAVTYSAGNEGQNICGVFSETAPLQRSSTPSVVRLMRSRPFLSLRKMRMRMSSPSISGALAHVYTLQPLRRGFAL